MYIPRHLEFVVSRLSARKPVIVLTGARQVGKSTMLKTFFPHFNYIALDHPLVRQSALDNPSSFFEEYRPPIIVDEIQKVGTLFSYIKDRVDAGTAKGQYFLTGSQSLQLMKNVSESLAGRAGVIQMSGLSMRELDLLTYTAPFLPTREHREAMRKNSAPFDYQRIIQRIHSGFSRTCTKRLATCVTGLIFTAPTFRPILRKTSATPCRYRMSPPLSALFVRWPHCRGKC